MSETSGTTTPRRWASNTQVSPALKPRGTWEMRRLDLGRRKVLPDARRVRARSPRARGEPPRPVVLCSLSSSGVLNDHKMTTRTASSTKNDRGAKSYAPANDLHRFPLRLQPARLQRFRGHPAVKVRAGARPRRRLSAKRSDLPKGQCHGRNLQCEHPGATRKLPAETRHANYDLTNGLPHAISGQARERPAAMRPLPYPGAGRE